MLWAANQTALIQKVTKLKLTEVFHKSSLRTPSLFFPPSSCSQSTHSGATELAPASLDTSLLCFCSLSLWEMADFLKQQGVINAVNLDGGGSATLVLNGTLASYPSDHW